MNRFSIAQLMLVGTYVGLVALLFVRWGSYLESLQPKFSKFTQYPPGPPAPFPWDVLFTALALGIWFVVWVWLDLLQRLAKTQPFFWLE